jgi:pimeloyl-ACP methyl ester carboxylesterase
MASALDDLGVNTPVDIAGWSYGALVTLDYALDNPERVRSLVLIEPPAFWVMHAAGKTEPDLQEQEAFLRKMIGDISEEKLEQFLCMAGMCPSGQSPRDFPQWPLWVQYRQALRNNSAILGQEDKLDRLSRFRRPVLLVKGIGSTKVAHEIIDELAARLPNVKVVEMPGGHAPHIVSMEHFIDEMNRFQKNFQD